MGALFGGSDSTTNETINNDYRLNQVDAGGGVGVGGNDNTITVLDGGAIDASFNAINNALEQSYQFSSQSIQDAFDTQQAALQTADDATSEALSFVSNVVQPEREQNEKLILLAGFAIAAAVVVPVIFR